MTLKIIYDDVAKNNWGARQFKNKIVSACKHDGIAYEITDDWNTDTSYTPEYNENTRYNNQIVIEPNQWQDDEDYPRDKVLCCLDHHTTANVVYDCIKGYMSLVGDVTVCLYGHGKLVGKPLSSILEKSNIKYNIINSKTSESDKVELIKSSDVIVTAISYGEKIDYDFANKYVIDVGNNTYTVKNEKGEIVFPNVHYKVIGEGTVQALIDKYKRMHESYEKCKEENDES